LRYSPVTKNITSNSEPTNPKGITMKYLVTVRAVIKKTIEVEAKYASEASVEALAMFAVSEFKEHDWFDIDVSSVHEKIEGDNHA
jgi:hypothetical protein